MVSTMSFIGLDIGSSSIKGAALDLDNLRVGSLFRAAFLNMADNYAACAAKLSPEREWRKLVLSGGLGSAIQLLS